MLLDEPTNHLDMTSKDVLKQSLVQFDGTLLVVSHDREFLEGLVTKTVEFRDHQVKTLLGGIDYYLEQRKLESMRQVEAKTAKKEAQKELAPTQESNLDYKAKKQAEKDLKSLTRKLEQVEEEIETLEGELGNWDKQLADPEACKELMADPDFYPKYEQKKAVVNGKMEEWEKINTQKELLEEQLSSVS